MKTAPDARRLAELIACASHAESALILDVSPLSGGSVRRHWRVDATLRGGAGAERRAFVLRSNGATPLSMGLDLAQEFALLQVLHAAGLPVPPPVLFCGDPAVAGAPFHLTKLMPGTADPAALVAAGPNDALAEQLGRTLAELHRIAPPRADLAFLGAAQADAALARIAEYRSRLDAMDEARPAAEWGLRWLARHAPPPGAPVLCHGDFRTGNYLVEDYRLSCILDWEFSSWGDPGEDVGWFCSRCWRFGARQREAGGIGTRAAFSRGYESVAGRGLDPSRLRYWETMAALKWLVIALLQRNRCLVAGERSLDLALTGRRAAECEYELMRLVEEAG